MVDSKFPKRLRLLTASEFERVMSRRISAADGVLRVAGAANDLGHPRVGLIVSRRVGNAVVRNRWKRAIREAFRLAQHDLPPIDLICMPQSGAPPDAATLGKSLAELARRIDERLRRASTR